jgi:hypothetical protein
MLKLAETSESNLNTAAQPNRKTQLARPNRPRERVFQHSVKPDFFLRRDGTTEVVPFPFIEESQFFIKL